jgi:hypothetical protein
VRRESIRACCPGRLSGQQGRGWASPAAVVRDYTLLPSCAPTPCCRRARLQPAAVVRAYTLLPSCATTSCCRRARLHPAAVVRDYTLLPSCATTPGWIFAADRFLAFWLHQRCPDLPASCCRRGAVGRRRGRTWGPKEARRGDMPGRTGVDVRLPRRGSESEKEGMGLGGDRTASTARGGHCARRMCGRSTRRPP